MNEINNPIMNVNSGKQNNYFTSMIQKYNGNRDFILFLKPEQIQKSAKERIFREMVRGQIDYGQFGIYYQNNKFLENLIVAANDELINAQIISNALLHYDTCFPGDLNVARIRTKQQILLICYDCIYSRLMQVKMTNDVGCLIEIQYVLHDQAKNF